jgi:hypothetical protein
LPVGFVVCGLVGEILNVERLSMVLLGSLEWSEKILGLFWVRIIS